MISELLVSYSVSPTLRTDIPAAFNGVFNPETPFQTSDECLQYLIEMYKIIDCIPHKVGLSPE